MKGVDAHGPRHNGGARLGKDDARAGGGGHVLRRSLRSLRSVIRRQDPPATECGPAKRPSGGEEDGSGARAYRALADAGSALADRGEPYGWPPPGVMAPLPVTLVVTCFGLPP